MSRTKSKTLTSLLETKKRNTEPKNNSASSSQLLHPTSPTLRTALSLPNQFTNFSLLS